MRAVIPNVESLRPDHPVHDRNAVNKNRNDVAADRIAWAQARKDKVIESINGRPGGPGPITPRTPSKPGNVSMYDHLKNLEDRYEKQPEKEADKHIKRLDNRIIQMDKAMEPVVNWPES